MHNIKRILSEKLFRQKKKKRTGKTRMKCLFCLLHKISIKIISKYSKTDRNIIIDTRSLF